MIYDVSNVKTESDTPAHIHVHPRALPEIHAQAILWVYDQTILRVLNPQTILWLLNAKAIFRVHPESSSWSQCFPFPQI